jgi:hypothetical protein
MEVEPDHGAVQLEVDPASATAEDLGRCLVSPAAPSTPGFCAAGQPWGCRHALRLLGLSRARARSAAEARRGKPRAPGPAPSTWRRAACAPCASACAAYPPSLPRPQAAPSRQRATLADGRESVGSVRLLCALAQRVSLHMGTLGACFVRARYTGAPARRPVPRERNVCEEGTAVGRACFGRLRGPVRACCACAGWALPALPALAAGAGGCLRAGCQPPLLRRTQPSGAAGGDGAAVGGGGNNDTRYALCHLLQRLGLPRALRALELAGCAPCARPPCPAGLPGARRRHGGRAARLRMRRQRALSAPARALAPRSQALAPCSTVRAPGAHCSSGLRRAELEATGQPPHSPARGVEAQPDAAAPAEAAAAPAARPGGPAQAPGERLRAERDALRLRLRRAGQEKAALLGSLARLRAHCAQARRGAGGRAGLGSVLCRRSW